MSRPVIAAFAMPDRGHFQRLRPLVSDLAGRDARVVVFTDRCFAAEVAADGGEFVDLFEGRAIDQPDDDSWPPAIRGVTFAAVHAADVRERLGALRVSLVLHDTFAAIGAFAAEMMGIPRVNVCAGHAVVPERFVEVLQSHPRFRVSAACERAIDRLRASHHLDAASPFSYVTAVSPDLNVYCEPSRFLPPEDRSHFEPVAFYGSLPGDKVGGPTEAVRSRAAASQFGAGAEETLKVYASFGTAIWAWRTAEAVSALKVVSAWAASAPRVRVLVSLGGAASTGSIAGSLGQANVRVVEYVDQWEALAGADVFMTHHGLNSTHEAIACEVPMLSYPFIWDQPGLAARCQALDLAVPLVATPMAVPSRTDLDLALDTLSTRRESMRASLHEAHQWEREVVAERPAIVDRILALSQADQSCRKA